MRSVFARSLALASITWLGAGTLAAQVTGIPVHNSGIPTGLGIAGEVGFPNAALGKGMAYGATGQVGLGPFGITASVASDNPKGPGPSVTSYGGTLNYKIFGGPLVPFSVTLQGGYAYFNNSGIKAQHLPIGLGIALNIPNPVLAIRPWIAPRLDVERVSGGVPSKTNTNFGVSGGLEFNFLGGLGLRASYDRVFAKGAGSDPSVFALGAHYIIKVPGL